MKGMGGVSDLASCWTAWQSHTLCDGVDKIIGGHSWSYVGLTPSQEGPWAVEPWLVVGLRSSETLMVSNPLKESNSRNDFFLPCLSVKLATCIAALWQKNCTRVILLFFMIFVIFSPWNSFCLYRFQLFRLPHPHQYDQTRASFNLIPLLPQLMGPPRRSLKK